MKHHHTLLFASLVAVILNGCRFGPSLEQQRRQQLEQSQALQRRLLGILAEVRGHALSTPPHMQIEQASPQQMGSKALARDTAAALKDPPIMRFFPREMLAGFQLLPEDMNSALQAALQLEQTQTAARYDVASGTITIEEGLALPDGSSLQLGLKRRTEAMRAGIEELESLGLGIHSRLLLHELVHAIQDQRYGILKLSTQARSIDAQLALLALLEGDATFTTWDIAHRALGVDLLTMPGMHKTLRKLGAEEMLSELQAQQIPQALQEIFLMPYYDGAGFAAAIVRSGQYQLLDEVYARIPTATTHILHPERYAEGFKPVSISLPAVPASFGGVKAGLRGTLGEARLKAILLQYGAEACAEPAAAAWYGDRYMVLDGTSDALPQGVALIVAGGDDDQLQRLEECMKSAPQRPRHFHSMQKDNLLGFSIGLDITRVQSPHLLAHLLDGASLTQEEPEPPLSKPLKAEPTPEQAALRFAADDGGHQGTVVDGWFSHPGFQLKIPIPDGWQAFTELKQRALIPLVLQRIEDKAAISFIVVKNQRDATLLAVAGETVAAMSGRFPAFAIDKEELVPSGCAQAYQGTFSYSTQTGKRRGFLGIVKGEGIVISLVMTVSQEGFATASETATAVMDLMSCTQPHEP